MAKSTPRRRWPGILIMALAGAALLALLGWGLHALMGGKSGKPRKPPTVTLLPDKPPPPPPPPKEQKKPEPKEDKREVKVEQPKEQPTPAQNEPLKMEGPAGAGDSAFVQGSVTRDYVAGDSGNGMFRSAFAARLQRHLQDQLNRDRKLRETDYRVTVRIWLRRDGSVEKAELAQSSGNATVDRLLHEALLQSSAMPEAPPENMPQPLRIRVTARGAG